MAENKNKDSHTEVKVYDDNVKDSKKVVTNVNKKKFTIKLVLLSVLFIILSFTNLWLLGILKLLPQDLYNIYIMLYILTRILYIALFANMSISGDKKDIYNLYSFFIVVELLMIVIYGLFIKQSVLISVLISIVFIISSLNFSKNLYVKNDGGNLVSNYILTICFNIVVLLFILVFLFYAFNNVPVLKQITEAIKFFAETGAKASEKANEVKEGTKEAVENAKNAMNSLGASFNDFIGGISKFFGG